MPLHSKLAIGVCIAASAAAFLLMPFDSPTRAQGTARVLPMPLADAVPGSPGLRTAVFAGGCFWGV